MSLFDRVFGRQREAVLVSRFFQSLSGYSPQFTTLPEGIYEYELTRAAIHSFATACSKLKPELSGAARANFSQVLEYRPNPYMDTTKFLYRLATIFLINNTAFIIPLYDDYGNLSGLYPVLPINADIVEHAGTLYVRYFFGTGQRAAIEYDRVGILTQFAYKDDFFGETNRPLKTTLDLLHTQEQGIINGIKSSANIRFLGKIAQTLKGDDLKRERDRLTEDNLAADNAGGILLYDAKIADLKPIDSKPFIANPSQMELIKNNVYTYFGTNEAILQNKFNEDQWSAYYEAKIEPWSLQMSLVLTNMLFTEREIAFGNKVHFTANRLQYASNKSKLDISTQLFDRGIITLNDSREIWNMAPVADGDRFYRRKEYGDQPANPAGGENNGNQTNEDDGGGAASGNGNPTDGSGAGAGGP